MYCRGPPAAGPPGTIELTLLLTSCEVAIRNQRELDVEIPISSQTHTKLANSNTAITANHHGWIADSWSYEPKTSTNEGHTR